MPAPDRARSRKILLKRVRRLLQLDGSEHGATDVRSRVLPFLSSLGSVALIGGAIRDIALAGTRGFSSDYDFVIYDSDRDTFIARMKACNGVRNRFGGFALNCFSTKVDVWHIEDTWARTVGLVTVSQPADLLHCTFFDWDSVVYELGTGKLILPPDYLERLWLNVMDIRLESNPNPMGSLVRALRRAVLWNVRFGPRLTAFSKRVLEEIHWAELVSLDSRAFSRPLLRDLNREEIVERLASPDASPMGEVTWPVPEAQLSLSLDHEMTSLSPV